MRSLNGKVYYIKDYGSKMYVGNLEELKHHLECHFDIEHFNELESTMNTQAFNFMWQGFVKWIKQITDKNTFKMGIIGVQQLKEIFVYDECYIGWERMSNEDLESMPEFEGW